MSLRELAPVSQSEVELAAPSAPAALDGGFARTGKPASVFPPAPGAEALRDDFTSDAEPVSLHDLGVVLGRAPVPPPWSGGAPRQEAAPREATQKKSLDAKPSFFQVDLAPPPAPTPAPAPAPARREELRGPDSGHEDLRRLVAHRDEGPAHHANSDIFGLRGALFTDAPKAPLVPVDLSALVVEDSPVAPAPRARPAPAQSAAAAPKPPPPPQPPSDEVEVDLDVEPDVPPAASAVSNGRAPLPEVSPAPPVTAPVRLAPVAELAEAPTARPASGAPGPVVAERRATASRRSGIASWAVIVSVSATSAAAIVVALRMGASSPHDVRTTDAPSAPAPATSSPGETAPQPIAADDRRDQGRDEQAPQAPPAAHPGDLSARRVEPARLVATAPTSPAPVPAAPSPSPVRPTAAPPPAAAPPVAAGGDFDQAAARVALAMAASQAAGCKQPDDPGGGGRVSVTFAPSGRATSAQVVGGPLQGTKTGACVARTFRTVAVPPFSGEPVTVTKTVTVR